MAYEHGNETSAGTRGAASLAWLIAAASIALAAAAATYAVSLRSQLEDARQEASAAAAQGAGLEASRLRLEQGANRLRQVVDIVTAPDARRTGLTGRGAAASVAGIAYWSESLGLVFHARSLPPLEAGRGYELWVIPPGPDAEAVSLGMLAVSLAGTSSHAVQLPDDLDVAVVAVSLEEAGGSPTGQPTSAPVVVGEF